MSPYFITLQCFVVWVCQLFFAKCKTEINPKLFTKNLLHFAKAHRPAVVLRPLNDESLSVWNPDLLTLIISYDESTDHSNVIKHLGRLIADGEIDFSIFGDVGHHYFARAVAEEIRLFSSKVFCFLDLGDSDTDSGLSALLLLSGRVIGSGDLRELQGGSCGCGKSFVDNKVGSSGYKLCRY